MPVTFEIFPDRSLSIVTFAGPFTVEETEATLASFRAQGGQSYPCIFEFDRPVANFRPENIKRLVSEMAPAGGGPAARHRSLKTSLPLRWRAALTCTAFAASASA